MVDIMIQLFMERKTVSEEGRSLKELQLNIQVDIGVKRFFEISYSGISWEACSLIVYKKRRL